MQRQISELNKQKKQLYIDLKIRHKDLKNEYKAAVEAIPKEPIYIKADTAEAEKNITDLSGDIRSAHSETVTLANYLQQAFGAMGLVVSAQTALQLIRKAAQEATEAVKEYDKYVTNLSIITGGDIASADSIIGELSDKSFKFKVGIADLETAYETLLRTGKASEELDDFLQSTIYLSKVGFTDSSTAAQNLVTIGNAFNLQSEQIDDVVSSLVALDASANTVAGKLSQAMAKVASNAQLAGLSIDELGAIISGLRDTTGRSEEEIATALNSITARLYNVKLGKYEIELEDGSIEDISQSLNNTERMLKTVGISLRDTNGEFKEMTEIIEAIVPKWNEFNNVQ